MNDGEKQVLKPNRKSHQRRFVDGSGGTRASGALKVDPDFPRLKRRVPAPPHPKVRRRPHRTFARTRPIKAGCDNRRDGNAGILDACPVRSDPDLVVVGKSEPAAQSIRCLGARYKGVRPSQAFPRRYRAYLPLQHRRRTESAIPEARHFGRASRRSSQSLS
jgi:hypothetical protein